MSLPSVAIVILNYNGRKFLEKFLPSVLASSYPDRRIIVADNASTDDSIGFLKQHYPTVELLLNISNLGFAGGYNWALERVEADYYILLNSDVEVTPNWIAPIIQLMETDKSIAACQPKLLAYHQKGMFEYAGAAGGWIDVLGYPFSRGRIFEVCESDSHQYDSTERIFWASGAAMFVRSTSFHEVGGFDGFFFAHMEEIDLCWRLQQAGYTIYAVPSSTVYHVGGGTLPLGFRKTFLNFRNNIIMLHKNLPFKEKLWKLPLRFALDMATVLKNLFAGKTDMCRAIIKAQYAVLVWYIKGKPKKQSKKAMLSLDGVYNGSVVWKYFAGNRKTFTEIVDNKR